jgi:histidine triad (HIT) family protein
MIDCIFCKIINHEIPADIFYEDENVIAMMDIKPVSRGHVLVIPKKHSNDLLTTDDVTLHHVITKIKEIAIALTKTVNAQGINISTNNGAAAGQAVFHLHFHLIPRFSSDGLVSWPHHDSEPKTRAQLAEEIKKNL